MLWELYQQGKINEAKVTAEKATAKADRYADDIASLQRSVNRLTLACQAMWELIREHSSITEEMLDAKIQEVDLRDGSADGRLGAAPVHCPACKAKSNSKRANCIMCGALLPKNHLFEA